MLTLTLYALLCSTANAQTPECIYTHFDKSFYAAGEDVWFKTYVFKDSSRIRSRVLHVELVDHLNQVVGRQKLLISNNSAFSKFRLPASANTGYYRFRAYTHHNLNFDPMVISEKLIPVFSQDEELPTVSESSMAITDSTATDTTAIDSTTSGGLEYPPSAVNFTFDKPFYRTRDSVKVALTLARSSGPLDIGNFSIAVIPLDLMDSAYYSAPSCMDSRPLTSNKFPTQRSLYLQGQLVDPNTKASAPPQVVTIYLDKSPDLIKTFTNQEQVKIPVYDFWGEGEFQIVDLDVSENYEFVVSSGLALTDSYYNEDAPVVTKKVYEYLQKIQQQQKIMNLFVEATAPQASYNENTQRTPDAVYRTEDYKDIYSFEEFINEAVGNVKVKSIKGAKTIRLFNRDAGDPFKQAPWYLIDGFMTYNEKEALEIQYQDIVEVRVYSRTSTLEKYFKHFMWNSGVVEVITRDVKYSRNLRNNPNIVRMEGFTEVPQFDSLLALPQDRITPDFRGVQYWDPTVYMNTQGYGEFLIPLSDDTGNFAVVIQGLDGSNRLIQGFSTFEVRIK